MERLVNLQKIIATKTPVFYGWWIIILTGIAIFFTGPAQTYSFSLFIDHFINDFGFTRAQVNNYYSLASLVSGLTMVGIGKNVDRFGAKKVMLIATLLLTAAMLVLSFMTGTFILLFLGFFLGRFSGPGMLGLAAGVVTPHWFIKRRGLAIMLTGLFGSLSASVFPKLNQVLINTYGWRTAFIVLGASLLIIFLPICFLFVINKPEDVGLSPDNAKHNTISKIDFEMIELDEKTSLTRREALKSFALWIILFSAMQASMIGTGLWLNFISITREIGLSEDFATTAMSISPILGLGSSLLTGLFIDKVKRPQILLAIISLMQSLSYVLLAFANSAIQTMAYAVIFGLTGAAFMLTQKLIFPTFFGRRHLGSIMGLFSMALVIGSSLGPTVFGNAFVLFNGYKEILLALAAIPVISAISLFFTKSPKKRHHLITSISDAE